MLYKIKNKAFQTVCSQNICNKQIASKNKINKKIYTDKKIYSEIPIILQKKKLFHSLTSNSQFLFQFHYNLKNIFTFQKLNVVL